MKKSNNIDKLFREGIGQKQFPVDLDNWENLRQQISPGRKNGVSAWFQGSFNRWLTRALAVAFMAFLFFWGLSVREGDSIKISHEKTLIVANDDSRGEGVDIDMNREWPSEGQGISDNSLGEITGSPQAHQNPSTADYSMAEIENEEGLGSFDRYDVLGSEKESEAEKGTWPGQKELSGNHLEDEGESSAPSPKATDRVDMTMNTHEKMNQMASGDSELRNEAGSFNSQESTESMHRFEGENSLSVQTQLKTKGALTTIANTGDTSLLSDRNKSVESELPGLLEEANSVDQDSLILMAEKIDSQSNKADSAIVVSSRMKRPNSWWIGLHTAYSLNEKSIISNASDWMDYRLKNEHLANHLEYGLSLTRQSLRFESSLGLFRGTMKENLSYQLQQTNYSYDTSYVLVDDAFDDFGQPVFLIEERVDSTAYVTEIAWPLSSRTNTISYVRIPLSIGYSFSMGSISLVPTLGASYTMVRKSSVFYVNSSLTGLTESNAGISQHSLAFSGGLRLDYSINSHWKAGGGINVFTDQYGGQLLNDFALRRTSYHFGFSYQIK